CLLYCIGARVF
nr:immunoglobulin light chain junction region [Macaca mulatta]MPN86432.1 immunoglobulin light chain junction region [Macaca mulatta]